MIQEYMAIGHQYFRNKWSTSVQAMTPLHGGAANGLKIMFNPHYQYPSDISRYCCHLVVQGNIVSNPQTVTYGVATWWFQIAIIIDKPPLSVTWLGAFLNNSRSLTSWDE